MVNGKELVLFCFVDEHMTIKESKSSIKQVLTMVVEKIVALHSRGQSVEE